MTSFQNIDGRLSLFKEQLLKIIDLDLVDKT